MTNVTANQVHQQPQSTQYVQPKAIETWQIIEEGNEPLIGTESRILQWLADTDWHKEANSEFEFFIQDGIEYYVVWNEDCTENEMVAERIE